MICIDLQQQMYMIRHNYSMIYCDCRIVIGDIIDTLPHNHTKVG